MSLQSNRRPVRFLLLLWVISVLLAGCQGQRPAAAPPTALSNPQLTALPVTTPEQTPAAAPIGASDQALAAAEYWPTRGWRVAAPAKQGMNADSLARMLDDIKRQNLNLHSLLVIRNGYIVSETYFGSYRETTRHELYSVTKSFVATLVGIAVDKGIIAGVDRPVLGFFGGRSFANQDAAKTAMTLEHLLTMTTGLDWTEGDAAYQALYRSPDPVKFMLDQPMRTQPGSQFNYCSGCSHLLSALVQGQARVNTRDFTEKELFAPLGIAGANWGKFSDGIPIGGWGLQLTPREMAKLGYLYLHNGTWDGRQIVSAAWVKAATTQHTATDDRLGYGYQWWIYPAWGAYTALGRGGQTIFVVPQLDLIVVTTADITDFEPIYRLIEEFILPAVENP